MQCECWKTSIIDVVWLVWIINVVCFVLTLDCYASPNILNLVHVILQSCGYTVCILPKRDAPRRSITSAMGILTRMEIYGPCQDASINIMLNYADKLIAMSFKVECL